MLLLTLAIHHTHWIATKDQKDEEYTPLLASKPTSSDTIHGSQPDSKYRPIDANVTVEESRTDSSSADDEEDDLELAKNEKQVTDRVQKEGNWLSYISGFSIFVPFVLPPKRWDLLLNVFGVVLCLGGIRALNILAPRQLGIVINTLGSAEGRIPVGEILLYVTYTWAASSAGLSALRQILWLPIEQSAYQKLTTTAYTHIMMLSCDFHDSKQTGELYQSLRQGDGIVELVGTIFFDVVPAITDLFVAFGYLYHLFDAYMALLVAATGMAHLWLSAYILGKASEERRLNRKLHRKENQLVYDTVGSWTTVSYFNRIRYEGNRYAAIIDSVYRSTKKLNLFYTLSYGSGSLAVDLGFLVACFLGAYQVIIGRKDVGSFATLIAYWMTLTSPLFRISGIHRGVMSGLVDAEQLLQLLRMSPSVPDGATALQISDGDIHFDRVTFSYDGKRQILQEINLRATPGQKIALVGETGGGKSTILKLLFRFYDVQGGSVRVDGQDIRDLTLESLRECIGVVPQDPSLFNDTITNNVRYSKLDASDEEVVEACKAAAVHDKIMSLTKGYASKVGERGVKLSGGELQRVAIARAILKDPKIILLDEATSSVDTETEARIQEALRKLTQGRTTFIVAHRLSTVMDADIIVVIKDGKIMEQGSPKVLLKAKGRYYDLWSKQVGIRQMPSDRDPTKSDSNRSSTTDPKQDSGEAHEHGTAISHEGAIFPEEGREDQGFSENMRPGLDQKRPAGNKVWKPDVPEFVPNYLKATMSHGGSSAHDHGESSHGQSYGTAPNTRNEKEQKRHFQKKKNKNEPSNPAMGSQADAADDLNSEFVTSVVQAFESKPRRTRFNRRKQSKSEPVGSGIVYSQEDSTMDFEPMPEGSDEFLPMRNNNRRASAPSDPPGRSPSQPGNQVSHNPRRRARKHWRSKDRNSSTTQSGAQSTADTNWSTESSRRPTPTAPFTSPSGGVTPADGLERRVGGSSVRFVSGS